MIRIKRNPRKRSICRADDLARQIVAFDGMDAGLTLLGADCGETATIVSAVTQGVPCVWVTLLPHSRREWKVGQGCLHAIFGAEIADGLHNLQSVKVPLADYQRYRVTTRQMRHIVTYDRVGVRVSVQAVKVPTDTEKLVARLAT